MNKKKNWDGSKIKDGVLNFFAFFLFQPNSIRQNLQTKNKFFVLECKDC
jgi:hypothetical protein